MSSPPNPPSPESIPARAAPPHVDPSSIVLPPAHDSLSVTETDPLAQAREIVSRLKSKLSPAEIWWRDHQPWLQDKGYMLRPRYRPGWVPSWEGKNDVNPADCEDGISPNKGALLDATRISDGKIVKLKKVVDTTHPYELEINRLFSSEPYVSHSRNHCAPAYDVLQVPDEERVHVIVMPLLRPLDDPSFETVGEAVECFHQIFEGLQFMHQCHVAHRDCMDYNIMMDATPLFPGLYHPEEHFLTMDAQSKVKPRYTRTERPVKYYLIDFGLSGIYNPYEGHTADMPVLGGDKTVPEFQNNMNELHEVYPTDVYYIGNMIRESFLQKYKNLEFMQSLVDDMVQADPKQRPTMDDVVKRFARIRRRLSWWKLRSRLSKEDGWVKYVLRTIGYVATFRSAIPSP